MIDTMNEIDYAFYLAYGTTQENESLDALLNEYQVSDDLAHPTN